MEKIMEKAIREKIKARQEAEKERTANGACIVVNHGHKVETEEEARTAWKPLFWMFTHGNEYPLGIAVANSVLRKLNGVSDCENISRMRTDIFKAWSMVESCVYGNATAYKMQMNKDGMEVLKTVSADGVKALEKGVVDILGDGFDIVHVAIVAIYEEVEKHNARSTKPFDLEEEYAQRVLNKKVWIKEEDSNAWKYEHTTPIREAYKAVRRYIESNKNRHTENGYSYVEVETDTEEVTAYKRLDKYSDLGGNVVDFNGAVTAYTTPSASVDTYNAVLESLNLTERQALIVSLRMRGYGYKAIATYLGVTHNAVINALGKIKAKCEKIGFTPSMWEDMTKE